ncbi:Enoyl-CoA hydratase/carnithine racemase [Cohaesibacter sp. ES.047]|uniref:enoyl-CoA hydratase n=1 Tax=Cohaesibacter sp. ES.047 TaxID=1798205 RepID=UPI000BB8FB36|nr:enoyl-CoA hydratase [Cohaesibacter sp. ES.047]SNY93116.1 Enoyl-CoA hydratase/carnithine racemase [Cohaesibacter sp. ES.047]
MSAITPEKASLVLVEQNGPVRRLTMNGPKGRNLLTEEMMASLILELERAGQDECTRVIILAANGPVFCGGYNLNDFTAHRSDSDGGKHFFARITRTSVALMQTIINIPKMVIAEVQGPAYAAGCQLVATCDLVIAVNEATFRTPGVDIGVFGTTAMVALTRLIPPKQAMEMLITGEPIDAHTAKSYGLVNRVVPLEYLQTAVDKYASEIANKSSDAIKFGKETFYRQADMTLNEAYDLASHVMTENLLHADAKEGISAYLEKRDPVWPSKK